MLNIKGFPIQVGFSWILLLLSGADAAACVPLSSEWMVLEKPFAYSHPAQLRALYVLQYLPREYNTQLQLIVISSSSLYLLLQLPFSSSSSFADLDLHPKSDTSSVERESNNELDNDDDMPLGDMDCMDHDPMDMNRPRKIRR